MYRAQNVLKLNKLIPLNVILIWTGSLYEKCVFDELKNSILLDPVFTEHVTTGVTAGW